MGRMVTGMHVILEPGSHACTNLGDVAMLQMAVRRLRAMIPDCAISVFDDDPDALARACPGVTSLPRSGRDALLAGVFPWRARRWLGGARSGRLEAAEMRLTATGRRGYRQLLVARTATRGGDAEGLRRVLAALDGAGAIVAAGQATIADAGGPQAVALLRTLQLGSERDLPVALMGQGIGPLEDPDLLRLGASVLPRACLVALREPIMAPGLLDRLGVAAGRTVLTGDDAVELAWEARPARPGGALGVHVRQAPRALGTDGTLELIASVLGQFVREVRPPLEALPIAVHRHGTHDPTAIRTLLGLVGITHDGGAHHVLPSTVIEAVGRCRAVMTGAYHVAVFALAQGIPVVCLGASETYLVKFRGLARLFGPGCRVVDLRVAGFPATLAGMLRDAWHGSAGCTAPLLAAAEDQVLRGRAAWARLGQELAPRMATGALRHPRVAP